MNYRIDRGTDATFVLALNITNPKVLSSQPSFLRVYAVLDSMDWSEGDTSSSGSHTGLRLGDNRILVGDYQA